MRALLGLLLTALAPALQAQVVNLRIESAGQTARVPGVAANGTSYYPIRALDRLGAATVADVRGARTTIFGDTLEFHALSPWFISAGGVEHLAFPVIRRGGIVHLPEQFFIQWLPAKHGARVQYRDGMLRLRAEAVASPAALRVPDSEPGATRVVILDPGHGGDDLGRVGAGSTREKDVALQIAVETADLLEDLGYEVHLTRSTDTLIALDDRPRIANQRRQDRPAVFVSIHANAADDRSARGFETFFLSEARTEDEQRVAEMENAAVRFEEDSSPGLSERDAILNGLRNDFWVRASNDLAEMMQSDLDRVHDGPNRGVKRAGFRVLVGALMPAVLVEVAFLSNTAEARLLREETFRNSMAGGIASAIHRFFESHGYFTEAVR